MPESKLVVLGSSGLLGSAVQREASASGAASLGVCRANKPNFSHLLSDPHRLLRDLGITEGDLLLNAVGKTKQRINSEDPPNEADASWLNSTVPREISNACLENNIRYIQIGTDCVFSGAKGDYVESDVHDAKDIYGVTKSLGENSKNVNLVRTSFVGPAPGANHGLWNWIGNQERKAPIIGFTNHIWNGVTVDAIAKLIVGGFLQNYSFVGVQHFVPSDKVTKESLVRLIANKIGRTDIQITPGQAKSSADMSLATLNPEANAKLWNIAGYVTAPSIAELISEQKT